MQLSGLVFLLFVSSAACFDIEIAAPKLGLRRLFRKPYRGSICVIEIVGAELTPIANCATARSLDPVAQPRPLSLAPGCAATLDEPTKPVRGSDEAAELESTSPTRRRPRLAQSPRPAIQGHAGSACGVEARVGLWRYPGRGCTQP